MTQMAQMEGAGGASAGRVGGKVVYVSGPISAGSAWEVEQNVRRAEAASAELFRRGVTNICVHSQGRFMDGLLGHGEWLEHDYALIDRCDAIYVCVRDFASSKGTRLEVEYAMKTGKRCFWWDEVPRLVDWARGLA